MLVYNNEYRRLIVIAFRFIDVINIGRCNQYYAVRGLAFRPIEYTLSKYSACCN